MNANEDPVIASCWAIFVLYWMVAASRTKPTANGNGGWSGRWAWLIIAAFVVSMSFSGGTTLWGYTPARRFAADGITVLGLIVAVWARTMLGGNWSARVVIKEQHELIERGPYRYVRHPIYTGVILMVLGTVMLRGRIVALMLFVVSAFGLWVKARREERLLTSHFPDVYPRYKARVRAAIIPFLL